jgi:hypothetical protein
MVAYNNSFKVKWCYSKGQRFYILRLYALHHKHLALYIKLTLQAISAILDVHLSLLQSISVLVAAPPHMVQWYRFTLLHFCMLFVPQFWIYICLLNYTGDFCVDCRASNGDNWYCSPHFSCSRSGPATTNLGFCSKNKYCKNQTESNVELYRWKLKSSFIRAASLRRAVATGYWIMFISYSEILSRNDCRYEWELVTFTVQHATCLFSFMRIQYTRVEIIKSGYSVLHVSSAERTNWITVDR